jgi:hypothetical protein
LGLSFSNDVCVSFKIAVWLLILIKKNIVRYIPEADSNPRRYKNRTRTISNESVVFLQDFIKRGISSNYRYIVHLTVPAGP